MSLNTEQVSSPPKLRFLWLELTEQCNERCKHCYRESGPDRPRFGSLTIEDWERIILQGEQEGCKAIQFIGGEPTLHPGLPHLIRHGKAHGMTIEVFTNGTRITDELWNTFQECSVDLAFSYYSSDAGEHDNVTTLKGSHYRTLQSMRKARDLGLNVRIGVIVKDPEAEQTTITLQSLKDDGFQNIGVDHIRGIGRGDTSDTEKPITKVCGNCWKGSLAIDPNGKAYPCIFSRFAPLGSVEGGLSTLLQGVKHQEFREELHAVKPNAFQTVCHPNSCGPNPRYCNPDEQGGSIWPFKCWPANPDFCGPNWCSP